MTKTSAFAMLAALMCFAAAPAQAQSARTFVSAVNGNDGNDCSRPAPCRTFQAAHDKTLDQGDITVLDPGGYGAVTIRKSISIVNDGVGEASILVSGGATGITVAAPNAYVNLRGLTVQGIGFGGGTGIVVTSAVALTITKCVIRNHTGHGIRWNPDATSMSRLAIVDTLIADNGENGIFLQPQGTAARYVSLSRVALVQNSSHGLLADGGESQGFMYVNVSDSVAEKNGGAGFKNTSNPTTATVDMLVVRSSSSNNFTGFFNGNNNNVTAVGDSTVIGNSTGASAGAGLFTFGDNFSRGNGDGGASAQVIGASAAKF